MTEGVLAVWTDADPQAEPAFNEWYTRQHLLERRGIPGFRFAARYRSDRARPRYFAWYRTDGVAVLSSPEYLARLNGPTPETVAVMPTFRNTIRAVMEMRARVGTQVGAVTVTVRMAAAPGRADALDAWVAGTALPAAVALPGIVSGELWVAAAATDTPPPGATAETMLRGPDGTAERVVAIQAETSAAAAAVLAGVLSPRGLAQAGARRRRAGTYRLLCLS